MSGIAGIIRFDGAPVEPGMVEKMTAAMAHRGPDGINHWVKGSVALGQCMLRTTPESLEERQPLGNEDESLVLVMDGRVDNWEELRRELLGRGAVLRDRSDAELVLRAYEEWGETCPDRIIGEYAFFIWDARQKRLFAARDAAGTRHFYYHAGNGWFGFASEIKGLLALKRIEPRLNESRLLDYLVVEFDRDDEVGTFYQGINRMPAGHAMTVTERGVKTWRHWNPGNLPERRFASLDECAEAFLEQLRIAVKCRLRSIGPVGAMLSGGLDSSSIVGLISKEFRDELRQPLRTFSLIREDRENCPDWLSIREMLKEGWLEPTIITSAIPHQFCRTFLDHISNADEPFVFTHGLNEFLIYKTAHENGCRVVLDGMAGDLLFYGYDRTLDSIFQRKTFKQIPAMLAAYHRHGIKHGIRKLARRSLRSVTPERARAIYRRYRDKRLVLGDGLKLLHREIAKHLLTTRYDQRNQVAGHLKSDNDQIDHARNFTSGLLSFAHEVYGQIALSSGVEPRSPFSDRRMIEFAIQMPVEAKLFTPWYKHVLRKSMDGVLPEEVRWRRDIGGHPGWKFYEQLILSTVHHAPEIWNLERSGSTLKRWIDSASLSREWYKYAQNADYSTGFNLYTLAILARWLSMQPSLTQPGLGNF
jgi:asparagine synthase (glutamine-hydrolysing)